MDRKALAFGRNQFNQLGLPETGIYEKPTLIPELENFNIIQAACGRNHTLFLTGNLNINTVRSLLTRLRFCRKFYFCSRFKNLVKIF